MSTTSLKDLYLILYNNALAVGWGMVWCIAVSSVLSNVLVNQLSIGQSLSVVYDADGLEFMLMMSQLSALLEIVHAMIGFVRSPVHVTIMQVMSRMVALLAILYSKHAQSNVFLKLYLVMNNIVESLLTLNIDFFS
jgi:very-long-chain (3R)-3-hydroxyacyl-CoA dehydratase